MLLGHLPGKGVAGDVDVDDDDDDKMKAVGIGRKNTLTIFVFIFLFGNGNRNGKSSVGETKSVMRDIENDPIRSEILR